MQMICVALPSWRAMQSFIDVLHIESVEIDMLCRPKSQKYVAMIFNPRNHNKIVYTIFPNFTFGSSVLQLVLEF